MTGTTSTFSRSQVSRVIPQNGLKGIKNWKQDMLAGLVVALVSVPLSLGIALSSGAPPICGLTSEIIAGLVFPFIGGSYVTICGPAAGLAPVLYSSILTLGKGNMETGYHLVTAVILFVGVMQIVLTYMKAARFSYLFPSAAIQGMLSSIGFMLIAKQIPNFIGHPYQAHEFWGMVMETPQQMVRFQPQVFAISSISLTLLFLIPKLRIPRLNALPPQLLIVIVAIILGAVWHLDPKYLVNVPSNLIEHGIVMPDFKGLFSDPSLIGSIIVAVLTLTFVDGTESLATILAVDKIDPWHRKSSPDRTLFAMGISNICSSLIGGLTIIPGIIKSTTCIHSGGRTAWVNFYNALFLITFLLLASPIIKMIPLGALAAVLVHIGWKLAGPHKWRHMWAMGPEQTLVYAVTILVTVSSDLLIGILAGIILKFLLLIFYNSRSSGKIEPASISRLVGNPISAVELGDNSSNIDITGPLVCFNSLYLRSACEKAFAHKKPIHIRLLPSVNVVDHSSSTFLQIFKLDCARNGLLFSIDGLDALVPRTTDAASLRFRPSVVLPPSHGLRIVLAVDNSEHSRVAIEEVKSTQWPKGSELTIATVVDVPFSVAVSAQHSDKAEAFVQEVASSIYETNKSLNRVDTMVLNGDIKTEIYELLRQSGTELLVTGSRSRKRMESLSHTLLLSAHCSVRICRKKKINEGTKVLVALDSSVFSSHALLEIARRPWNSGTEFVCVSAVPTFETFLHDYPDCYEIEELQLNRNKQIQFAEQRLEKAVATLKANISDVSVRYQVIDGEPSEALLAFAENENCNLIVMGSAGKNLAERIVVGSVSEAIAVWAPCSVEVISSARANGKAEGAADH